MLSVHITIPSRNMRIALCPAVILPGFLVPDAESITATLQCQDSRNETSYAELAALMSTGAQVRITGLTEAFDFSNYKKRYSNKTILLFAIDPDEALHFFKTGDTFEPEAGWKLAGLLPDEVIENNHDEGTDITTTRTTTINEVSTWSRAHSIFRIERK